MRWTSPTRVLTSHGGGGEQAAADAEGLEPAAKRARSGVDEQALRERGQEGERLAGSSVRRYKDVAAAERWGEGLVLHG